MKLIVNTLFKHCLKLVRSTSYVINLESEPSSCDFFLLALLPVLATLISEVGGLFEPSLIIEIFSMNKQINK